MRTNWDAIIRALALVRIGQELGSDTKVARMIHDLLDLIAGLPISLFL